MEKSGRGIQLIVGLGNPGPEYAATRHNVGFWFIEKLCHLNRSSLAPENKFKGLVANLLIDNKNCKAFAPLTYMNLSGQAVISIAKFYKISPEEILVVHDELDLPPGTARLKREGGHGGHNGLRDIIAHLGTHQFYRLRLGIGHPGNKEDVLNFVLHKPSLQDKEKIHVAIDQALTVIPLLLEGKTEKAMHVLHTSEK